MQWAPISLFYFACLALGSLYAIFALICGEIFGHADVDVGGHDIDLGHDMDMGGHDLDVGEHDVGAGHGAEAAGASVFNSLTIATFIAFLGLSGLFAVWVLKMSPFASLAFALPVAIVTGAAQFVLYVKLFLAAQASSEATMAEVLGCQAEVITAIPGDRVGEIAYVIKGSRYNAPATSADGNDIPRGTRVTVVNVRANVLVVRPL